MKQHRVIHILCVLLLLLPVLTAGCTVNVPLLNTQLNPSHPPSGINSSVTSNGTAHMLAVTDEENGTYTGGTVSNVIVYTQLGTGHVFVETEPLTGFDFQTTARYASLSFENQIPSAALFPQRRGQFQVAYKQ